MAQEKSLYNISDDEHDISANFERNHAPSGFRPHEILRVTVPMMAQIQEKCADATTVKKAWIYLCGCAEIDCDAESMNSAPIAQRAKQAAKADTTKATSVKLDAGMVAKVATWLKANKNDAKKCETFLKKASFDEAHAKAYILEATKVDASNPFL